MKRILSGVLLLVFVLCGVTVTAQVKRLAVGVKGGTNFSRVNLDNAKSVRGAVAGITSEYWLNEYSALSLDILYAEEGYQVPTTTVEYSYVQIPLMYHTFLGNGSDLIQPKFGLGFSPGFLLKAEANGVDFKDQNTATILNFVGGVGLVLHVGERLGIHLEARGFLGLTSPDSNSNPDPIKNRTLQLNLGVAFGL
ncbi:MAG: PorT family protein [Saprospiraceae bacterium]|nr:PorT family protein [Saprospiraceae bacterium]